MVNAQKKSHGIELLEDFPVNLPLGEAVYQSLISSLFNGNLKPGQMLSENIIASRLGVSRTPVREALNRLQIEGLVTPIRGRRVIVSIPSDQDIEDVYNIRLMVETEALRKISREDLPLIQQLETYALEAKQYLTQNDIIRLGQKNTQFHQCLISVLKNRRLEMFLDSLRDVVSLYRFQSLRQGEWAAESGHDHEKLVNFLKEGSYDKAIELLQKHLMTAKEILIRMANANRQKDRSDLRSLEIT
jgi:DNA-binding GntR family transcriptional regulator